MKKFFLVSFLLTIILLQIKNRSVYANIPLGNYLEIVGGYAFTRCYFAFSPNSITIEAWINPKSIDSLRQIISIGDDINGSLHYEIGLLDGTLSFYFHSGARSKNLLRGGTLKENNWSHIAATISIDKSKLFLNGVLVAESSGGQFLPAIGSNIVVGTNHLKPNINPYSYKGAIEEVRISDAERNITSLWQEGKYLNPLETDKNTVLLWHFNEPRGEIKAYDSSGRKLDGILKGGDSFIHFAGNFPLPSVYFSPTPTPRRPKFILPTLKLLSPLSYPSPTPSTVPSVPSYNFFNLRLLPRRG